MSDLFKYALIHTVVTLALIICTSVTSARSDLIMVKRSDHDSEGEPFTYGEYFDYDGASGSGASQQYGFPIHSDGRLAPSYQPYATSHTVPVNPYPPSTTREWHSNDYDLHEYLYARSLLENAETGEILPREWRAMLDNQEAFALTIQRQYHEKALKPLRAIRHNYRVARRPLSSITEAEVELDYCEQVCGSHLIQDSLRDNTDPYVLEARAMFQHVKSLFQKKGY